MKMRTSILLLLLLVRQSVSVEENVAINHVDKEERFNSDEISSGQRELDETQSPTTAQPTTTLTTPSPTPEATTQTTQMPTAAETLASTDAPTIAPTTQPTTATLNPSSTPSMNPTTNSPSSLPSKEPQTDSPSSVPFPLLEPTLARGSPSAAPSIDLTTSSPSSVPTSATTSQPAATSLNPSSSPSMNLTTTSPTSVPSEVPTELSNNPSSSPSMEPQTVSPSSVPSLEPTSESSFSPSSTPSIDLTTSSPSSSPTTSSPTPAPSMDPQTTGPSSIPSLEQTTGNPSATPSVQPVASSSPSSMSSIQPTGTSTISSSSISSTTASPSDTPSISTTTASPSDEPSALTMPPSSQPSMEAETAVPSSMPSIEPYAKAFSIESAKAAQTSTPSDSPTIAMPSSSPSSERVAYGLRDVTKPPTASESPSSSPSSSPTSTPTTGSPTFQPTAAPTLPVCDIRRLNTFDDTVETETVVSFLAMGDIPYQLDERYCLNMQLRNVSLSPDTSENQFMIHVGDIKEGVGGTECDSDAFDDIAEIFTHTSNALNYDPRDAFFVVGDNEWTDCTDRDEAWEFWMKTFGPNSGFGTLSPEHGVTVDRQWNDTLRPGVDRSENFAFYMNEVLFMGINLPGGPQMSDEKVRLTQNFQWVRDKLAFYSGEGFYMKAAVLFGHAQLTGKRYRFFGKKFMQLIGSTYQHIPVMYLHGNGHDFCVNYIEEFNNTALADVEVDDGGSAPPLSIKVLRNVATGEHRFTIDRQGGRYAKTPAKRCDKGLQEKTWTSAPTTTPTFSPTPLPTYLPISTTAPTFNIRPPPLETLPPTTTISNVSSLPPTIQPPTPNPTEVTTLSPTGQNTSASDLQVLTIIVDNLLATDPRLGICQGDCDSNRDCEPGLRCFKRDGFLQVPGCSGSGKKNKDYCFDPSTLVLAPPLELTPPPTSVTVPPLPSPTLEPSLSPSDMPTFTQTTKSTSQPSMSTLNPTIVPTAGPSATQANMEIKELKLIAINIFDTDARLGRCQGDCDRNGDCEPGLRCYKRDGFDPIPSCSGPGVWNRDYCYDPSYVPPPTPPSPYPELTFLYSDPPNDEKLGLCSGDCDRDNQCEPGLVCFKRDGFGPVPGCSGLGRWNKDYCHNATATLGPSTSEVTPDATGSPTSPPTTANPTGQPTARDAVLPVLTFIAEDPPNRSLGLCEGDCDRNRDCKEPYVCFKRDSYDPVPGCQGGGVRNRDYCVDPNYVPPPTPPSPFPELTFKYNDPPVGVKMGLCQGDCDYDGECESGLVCYRRDGFDAVPGCSGLGKWNKDYCHKATQIPEIFDAILAPPLEDAAFPSTPSNSPTPATAQAMAPLPTGTAIAAEKDSENLDNVPRLESAGSKQLSNAHHKLGHCIGHCTSNAHCQEGLVCFERTGFQKVPGCRGRGVKGDSYCTSANNVLNTPSPKVFPLQRCQGHCRRDKDCGPGLKCRKRKSFQRIPGCLGQGVKGRNYCFAPQ